MASDKVIQVSDGDFSAKALQSETPFLLDFWAPWCGPCKAIGPVIDELAAEFEGKVKIGKMNVDDNPDSFQGGGGCRPGDRRGGQAAAQGHDRKGSLVSGVIHDGFRARFEYAGPFLFLLKWMSGT